MCLKSEPSVSPPLAAPPVSRDQFDEAIKEFEVTLRRGRCDNDLQYIREYAINFNTCDRITQASRRAVEEEAAFYDDVFSEYSDIHDLSNYSDVHDESDLSTYSDVHDDSNLSTYSEVESNLSTYSDVHDDSSNLNLQKVESNRFNFSKVESNHYNFSNVESIDYSNYSNVDETGDYSDVYTEVTALPPPLPRRMSDTRPPARPPVPSFRRRQ